MMESHVRGVPCLIDVTLCNITEPNPNCTDSDWDYHGGVEIEFDVYDRKGYRAKWLEEKLAGDDIERIESEIVERGCED